MNPSSEPKPMKAKTPMELLVELAVNYAKYGTCYPTQEQIEAEAKKAPSSPE